ncbi:hypothetical protein Ciccas_012195, partial [Cichlidogyrus casuarinus]
MSLGSTWVHIFILCTFIPKTSTMFLLFVIYLMPLVNGSTNKEYYEWISRLQGHDGDMEDLKWLREFFVGSSFGMRYISGFPKGMFGSILMPDYMPMKPEQVGPDFATKYSWKEYAMLSRLGIAGLRGEQNIENSFSNWIRSLREQM